MMSRCKKQKTQFDLEIEEVLNMIRDADSRAPRTSVPSKKTNFHQKMERKADAHLKEVLKSLGLKKFFSVMAYHQINYVQFLRLKRKHLIELGITNPADIKTILDFTKDVLSSPACQDGSGNNIAQYVRSDLTLEEIKNRLQSIDCQLGRSNSAIRIYKERLMKDPSQLRWYLEAYPIPCIKEYAEELREGLQEISLNFHLLEEALQSCIQNGDQEQTGQVPENQVKKESMSPDFKSVLMLGIGILTVVFVLRRK